jgi:transposase InsO family protein
VLDERHLTSVLAEFLRYYTADRPHRTLGMQTPERKPRLITGAIRSRPVLNGRHHVYERVA